MMIPNGNVAGFNRTCGDCRHSQRNTDGLLECWLEPPQVMGQAFMMPPKIPGGPTNIRWAVQAVRPPVKIQWTCGHWEPKPSAVN